MVWPGAVMMSRAMSQTGMGHSQGENLFYRHNFSLKYQLYGYGHPNI